MSRHIPSVAAIAAAAALPLVVMTAAASASVPDPGGDTPPAIAELCAATGDDSIDALLAGVADTDLVESLAPLLGLTVPTEQGRVLRAGVDVDDVREALDCDDTTPTAPGTSTAPAPSSPARDERDCSDFASRQDAQDFYDSVTTPADPDPSNLDADGDGVACEPTEGAAASNGGLDPTADDGSTADIGGGQVVEVPEGSASTGGGV